MSQALDWQNVIIQNTQALAPYYTSQEKIRSFYSRQRTQTAENIFGEDLWDHFEVYNLLKEADEMKAARQYWKDNPQLGLYMKFRDETDKILDQKVNDVADSIPEAAPPIYRNAARDEVDTEGALEAMSFEANERNNKINSLVRAYSQAYTDQTGKKESVTDAIRKQANRLWPGTTSQARRYYGLADSDPEAAVDYIIKRAELQQRVAWEYDKIIALDLMSRGELVRAAGIEGFEGVQPTQDEAIEAPQPQVDPNTPLGRLLFSEGGLPDHLAEAYGVETP